MRKVGNMTHRLTIQRRSSNVDDYGNVPDVWENICTVWASIQPLSGHKSFSNQQDTSEVSYCIYIRYRSDINDKMRAFANGKQYQFQAVVPDKKADTLTIKAQEVY